MAGLLSKRIGTCPGSYAKTANSVPPGNLLAARRKAMVVQRGADCRGLTVRSAQLPLATLGSLDPAGGFSGYARASCQDSLHVAMISLVRCLHVVCDSSGHTWAVPRLVVSSALLLETVGRLTSK